MTRLFSLSPLSALLPLALLACDGSKPDNEEPLDEGDADGDGYAAPEDCDDAAAAVNPGAAEACDEIDNNCDGQVDEGATTAFYLDADGDGYGGEGSAVEACDAPADHIAVGGDCNDTDTDYNPGAAEDDCTDPNDYNCDGTVAYADADGDGAAACEDCDDSDAAVQPGADEVCDGADNDCDGDTDADDADIEGASVWYTDGDSDGFGDEDAPVLACDQPTGTVEDDTDCDDSDAAINPGKEEICGGEDEDCDGQLNEDGASGSTTVYRDNDNDGYGDASAARETCGLPGGYVEDGTDCDDGEAATNPGETEVCDDLDNDCDGLLDEDDASDADTWYLDADGDGYGVSGASVAACDRPAGYSALSTDCDDGDAARSPGDAEVCDDIDNDCDGITDEAAAIDAQVWYPDADGDTFGDEDAGLSACEQPSGYLSDGTDCDDLDAATNPGAVESCDYYMKDNDCDGELDEDGALGSAAVYADNDGDGHGDAGDSRLACGVPSGYVAGDADCDDADADVSPDADEACNGYDDDCDGETDEDSAADAPEWYLVADSDGYGDDTDAAPACEQPPGYAAEAGDCDNGEPAVHPGADEACDGVDNDCNGILDDETWYADGDGDGYGDPAVSMESCGQPAGYVRDGDDCDDADAGVYPGAAEECDGLDNDCDGAADGSGSGCSQASCLDFVADYAGIDGLYEIDPDEDGLDVVEVYCDMTTDGGGWTLISWTGDSTVTPLGVPYPGLAVCPTQDCLRGSAAETDVLDALLQISQEVGIGLTLGSLADYQNLEDYTYAGAYDYGSLAGFYLDPGNPIACNTSGFAAGTFRSFANMAAYDGVAVYLAQSFRYSSSAFSYNDFDESQKYIWLPGAPNTYCDPTGSSPGSWLGNWSASEHEYGPYLGSTTGARAVWLR